MGWNLWIQQLPISTPHFYCYSYRLIKVFVFPRSAKKRNPSTLKYLGFLWVSRKCIRGMYIYGPGEKFCQLKNWLSINLKALDAYVLLFKETHWMTICNSLSQNLHLAHFEEKNPTKTGAQNLKKKEWLVCLMRYY